MIGCGNLLIDAYVVEVLRHRHKVLYGKWARPDRTRKVLSGLAFVCCRALLIQDTYFFLIIIRIGFPRKDAASSDGY